MAYINSYIFRCPAKDLELKGKNKILRHYYFANVDLTHHQLNQAMGGDFEGTFEINGDVWTFEAVFAQQPTPKEAKQKKEREQYISHQSIAKPYTKIVGNFLVTYSGHTHRPIMTSFYSPQNTTI